MDACGCVELHEYENMRDPLQEAQRMAVLEKIRAKVPAECIDKNVQDLREDDGLVACHTHAVASCNNPSLLQALGHCPELVDHAKKLGESNHKPSNTGVINEAHTQEALVQRQLLMQQADKSQSLETTTCTKPGKKCTTHTQCCSYSHEWGKENRHPCRAASGRAIKEEKECIRWGGYEDEDCEEYAIVSDAGCCDKACR
jgi:hypothetical protein